MAVVLRARRPDYTIEKAGTKRARITSQRSYRERMLPPFKSAPSSYRFCGRGLPWPRCILPGGTMPHYLIQVNSKHEFSVSLHAPDGALLLVCPAVTTHAIALATIVNVRSLAPFESRYVRLNSSPKTFSYELQDHQERSVGRGTTHLTERDRDAAISACRAYALVARVADLTGGGRALRSP